MSFNISHAQGELLAQYRPTTTSPETAFTADQLRVEITLILCVLDPTQVLTVAGQSDVAVYHDDDGVVYDQSTIILSETRLQLLQTNDLFQAQHPGSGIHIKPGGSLGVQVDDADDVLFSFYGITETLAERTVGR